MDHFVSKLIIKLLFNGFHRKSSAKIIHPSYKIHPDGSREIISDKPLKAELSKSLAFCEKF